MQPLARIHQLLVKHLSGLESQYPTGRVMYSSAVTLKPGPIYFLGLNPGGEFQSPKDEQEAARQLACGVWPLMQDCDRIASKPDHWSAYADETWGGKGLRLQNRVGDLLTGLGYNPRQTPAANLIFLRSRSQPRGDQFWSLAERCWPVHEYLLGLIQPRVVLAFGSGGESAYSFLKRKAGPCGHDEATIPAGHLSWKCRKFDWNCATDVIRVVAVPHLSRYAFKGKPEVMAQLRQWCAWQPEPASGRVSAGS